MDWVNIAQQIFEVAVVPLLGLLVAYAVSYINAKRKQVKEKTNDELARKYTDMLSDTIINCVIATNQTYVEALKNKNAFTEEAQKEALEKTYKAVIAILSKDAVVYLQNIYGDLNEYILNRIESEVNTQKAIGKCEE